MVLKTKHFLYFTILFALTKQVDAQTLLFQIKLGDCIKCKAQIDHLLSNTPQNLPFYFLFPDNFIEDKQVILDKLDPAYTSRIIFSDALCELYGKQGTSLFSYIDRYGEEKFMRTLTEIELTDAKTIDSLYQNDYYFKVTPAHLYRYMKGNITAYNYQLTALKTYTEIDTINYRLDNEVLEKIKLRLLAYDPNIFDLSRTLAQSQPGWLKYLMPSVSAFEVAQNGDVYQLVSVPYMKYIATDSLRKLYKDSVSIAHKHIIMHYRDTSLLEILLLKVPGLELGDQPGFTFPNNHFIIANDSTFYFIYLSNKSLLEQGQEPEFIAEFTKQEGMLEFNHQLNSKRPNTYTNPQITLSYLNFIGGNYPYHMPSFSRRIYNLQSDSSMPVDYESYPSDTTLFSLPVLTSRRAKQKSFPFSNHYIKAEDSMIYLYYSVEGEKYLKLIAEKTMNTQKTIKLDKTALPVKAYYPFFQIASDEKVLLLEDLNGFVRGYPLDLIQAL